MSSISDLSANAGQLAPIYAKKWADIKGLSILKNMKLLGVSMPEVKLKDGSPAPKDLFRFILVSYGRQLGKTYAFDPEADAAAALLSYDSLCDAMETVSGNLNGPAYPSILPLLCRFGSPKQIKQLITSCKSWDNWSAYGAKGRTARTVLEQALVLSDTKAAAVFLEQHDRLHLYAQFRGIKTEEVYEKYLFDFDFNEAGVRIFDLGSTTIEVTLTADLGLTMVNTATGKPVKSIPKRGVDPAVQKKAANDLDDMRQNLKKAVKIKQNQLWLDYLEGTALSAANWKDCYLKNPFLNRIARILVWEQNGNTFLLTDSGAVDSAGRAYPLTDFPVRIAHPMEMQHDDLAAWQRYFTARALKQPFQQIWEPVCAQSGFQEDRYADCPIRAVYFRSQERRGIHTDWSPGSYYEDYSLRIDGFDLEAVPVENDSGKLEIVRLCPEAWNRRANTVIAYLDRITVYSRIKKDDTSVMNQIGGFTLAQIMEFIALAQEHGAVNVTALLLDYKNKTFEGLDPMEEFTLDW